MGSEAHRHLAQLFSDVYAASGWHPRRRQLAQILANASAAMSGGGGPRPDWDAAGAAAALLEAVAAGSAWGGPAGGSASIAEAPEPPDPSQGGPVDINWLGLLLAALLIGVNGLLSVWLRLGLHGKLAVATVRCIAQLSVLGYILVPIFRLNRWWLTLAYSLFMLVVAAVEAVSRPALAYRGMLLQVLLVLGVVASCIITYGLALVVRVSPWYEPQYLVPLLGMLAGNACSGVAVGLSTILDELSAGRDKVESLLSMGASRLEATREVVQRATRMAVTPLLNTMNVVGIVSIPGMMTGQILGGSDPSIAARYQIVVMFLIGAATGLSAVATVFFAVLSLVDDHHRLRSERLQQRTGSKGAVSWLASQAVKAWRATRARSTHLASRLRRAFARGPGRRRSAHAPRYRQLSEEGAAAEGGARSAAEDGDGGSDGESLRLPPRLQQVLVAGSVGSASNPDGASPGGTSPRQPLLIDSQPSASSP